MATSIVVGTNSYITTVNATAYVAANYITTSAEYIAWAALSDANKEIYLIKATKKIDRQHIRGVKAIVTQTLQFPRAIYTEYNRNDFPTLNIVLSGNWVVEQSVSQNVIDAQVEESLALMSNSSTSSKRLDLQAQGVTSISLGNLSESYSKRDLNATRLLSQEARELLSYYTTGGALIR